MELSKELILGLGFKEVKVNEFDMYKYCENGIGALYLEKGHNTKEFYYIYKMNDKEELTNCGNCDNLESLFENMMKINNRDSIKLGKELKQQEIKSVLGL